MAGHININGVSKRSGRRTHRIAKPNRGERWQPVDAERFLFKGQCYDAGSAIFRACDLCGEPIRLVYVVKVIESPSYSYSPEIDKLDVGECCFKRIEAVNEKLYRQLLAAAVNLRTYIEAIEQDQGIFGSMESEKVESALPLFDVAAGDAESILQWFEELVKDGGDHA